MTISSMCGWFGLWWLLTALITSFIISELKSNEKPSGWHILVAMFFSTPAVLVAIGIIHAVCN